MFYLAVLKLHFTHYILKSVVYSGGYANWVHIERTQVSKSDGHKNQENVYLFSMCKLILKPHPMDFLQALLSVKCGSGLLDKINVVSEWTKITLFYTTFYEGGAYRLTGKACDLRADLWG